MLDLRTDHACDRIKRNGRNYLAVFGGRYGPNTTLTNTIEFYDLTLKPAAWETFEGIILPFNVGPIYGSKITIFDDGICEAYFINDYGRGIICSGNYTWKSDRIQNTEVTGQHYFPVVDANLLGGDVIW